MKIFDSKSRINKHTLFIAFRFLAEFVSRASTIVTFPLMARYLGTEGYGVNAQINTIITFLVPIASLGLGFAVVRLIAGNITKQDVSSRFYSTIAVVGIVSSLLSLSIFLFAPIINSLFIKVTWATETVQWSAPLIFFTAIETVLKDYYRARLRIVAYSVFQILQTIIYVAGLWFILTKGGGLLQIIWLLLVIKIAFNIIAYIYFLALREISFFPVFTPRKELSEILRFGIPIVIAGLGTWVTNVGDRWIIGYFMTIDDVGVYNAAYTLTSIITALASPFWTPLYPLMSTYFNDNNMQAFFHATRKYTNGYSIIAMPAVVGIIFLANPLLLFFGSEDFSISTITITLIMLGIFIDQFSASIQYQIYLHNETQYLRNVTIISSLLNIVLNVIFVPLLGITGAAVATFSSYLLLDGLLLVRVISYGVRLDNVFDVRTLSKYISSSLLMGFMLIVLFPNVEIKLINLIIIVVTAVLLYTLVLLALHHFSLKKLITYI